MTPVDPNEAAKAAASASDYWVVLHRFWPIAVIGGTVAVVVRMKSIFGNPGWKTRVFLIGSEWATGATAAMLSALLLPLLTPKGMHPSIEAEIGLCGFIGGSMGKGVFRYFHRKYFA